MKSLNPCFNGRCTRTVFAPEHGFRGTAVLILVLMEDALVHYSLGGQFARRYTCLNPCFNGRCTRTSEEVKEQVVDQLVLILVLMEDALVHR